MLSQQLLLIPSVEDEEDLTIRRQLYDQIYLGTGCPIDLFDEDTAVDNLPWTYGTNYAIAVIGIVGFIKLFFFPRHQPQLEPRTARKRPSFLVPTLFLLTGITFFIAGFYHVLFETNSPQRYTLTRIAFLSSVAPNSLTVVIGLRLIGVSQNSVSKARRIAWWAVLIVFVGASIYAALENYIALNILGGLAYILLAIAYCVQLCSANQDEHSKRVRNNYIFKIVAVAQFLIGPVMAQLLYERCGSLEAYKNCFEDCPIPARVINHNAIFHFFFIAGLIIYIWAEDVVPSIDNEDQQEESGEATEGPQKLFDDEGV
jgi:lysylphosphatidylglycerol synthetase-like protein (DUF2156 family)